MFADSNVPHLSEARTQQVINQNWAQQQPRAPAEGPASKASDQAKQRARIARSRPVSLRLALASKAVKDGQVVDRLANEGNAVPPSANQPSGAAADRDRSRRSSEDHVEAVGQVDAPPE